MVHGTFNSNHYGPCHRPKHSTSENPALENPTLALADSRLRISKVSA
jgi:hypothetical protein